MPRALIMQRTVVPAREREKYLQRLRRRKADCKRANCNFWVFEEAGLRGAFIEFTEAADRATLTAALAGAAQDGVVDPGRVYTEVDLD